MEKWKAVAYQGLGGSDKSKYQKTKVDSSEKVSLVFLWRWLAIGPRI